MVKVFFLIATIFLFTEFQSQAQGIRGNIRNVDGEPVPYTAIYVSALQKGTTANEDGFFQLGLPYGIHEVRFQYLGYQTQIISVDIDSVYEDVEVVFEQQHYRLPEVIVTASGEDPAYYIMRRAIAMSQYYLNQVSSYSSRVYLKGSGVVNSMPALMKRQLERDGVEEGKYFVSEAISNIHFELPDRYRTEVVSMRSSGDDNQSSPMAFVTISLYRDINGIISPLSRNAFQVYRFVLEGSFIENGDQINRIRVIPRRPGSDLYSGTIFIRDGSWNLHSADLKVSQNLFTIGIRQVYNQVAEHVWMPVSHNFDINLSLLGFDVDFTYLVAVSDYKLQLNNELDHDFYLQAGSMAAELFRMSRVETGLAIDGPDRRLEERKSVSFLSTRQEQVKVLMAKEDLSNREMRKMNRLIRQETRTGRPKESLEVMPADTEIADSARYRSHEYWEANRPVPLTAGERDSFEDSLPDTTEQDTQLSKRAVTIRKLLAGSRYKTGAHWNIEHNGLLGLSALEFNTVDGIKFGQQIRMVYSPPGGRQLSFSARAAYTFARRRLLSEAGITYRYHPFRRASISLSGGRATSDYNADRGIPPIFNTITSLYFKQNFMKIYEKDFFRLDHQIDIVNGLVLGSGFEYAKRSRLGNHSDFFLTNPFLELYSPNLPPKNGLAVSRLEDHHAALLDISLAYTPRYFYRLADQRKVMLYSNYPTLTLAYRGGVSGLFKSNMQFGHLEASLSQRFNVQMLGQFTYHLVTGSFFDGEEMFFADYKHFYTNPLWVKPDNNPDMFRTLPYYRYSTNGDYGIIHLQYDHSRILLKRLPVLAGKIIREKIFFNGLMTHEHRPYYEIGYGLDQIFLIFSAEVVTAFSGGKFQYTGFRIGIPLSEASIRL